MLINEIIIYIVTCSLLAVFVGKIFLVVFCEKVESCNGNLANQGNNYSKLA